MNVNKLKGKLVEKEIKIPQLAVALNIDPSTLYRKLNNDGETLTIGEANKIVEILDLTKDEAMAIFFNRKVA